jgi:hypothetical protein
MLGFMTVLLGFAIFYGFVWLMVLYLGWEERRGPYKPDPTWPLGLTLFVGGPLAFMLAGALLGGP